jgi:hypothetical protein
MPYGGLLRPCRQTSIYNICEPDDGSRRMGKIYLSGRKEERAHRLLLVSPAIAARPESATHLLWQLAMPRFSKYCWW